MDLQRITDELESVSRIYAERHGITRDPTWFVLKLQEEVGELTQAFRTGCAGRREIPRREVTRTTERSRRAGGGR